MDSHSYKDVHDENPFTMKWIVIHTNMSMTETNKNMDSHSYKDVHDVNQYTEMDSHSFRNVHDDNP